MRECVDIRRITQEEAMTDIYYTPDDMVFPIITAVYSMDDLHAAIGGTNWMIGPRTRRIVALYGEDVICLSHKSYRNAQRLAHLRRTEGFG
jgi:hypothetical protein